MGERQVGIYDETSEGPEGQGSQVLRDQFEFSIKG